MNSNLLVSDINIQVVRKNVKNINFLVRSSDGFVRVSAPKYLSEQAVQMAILSKINWIRNKVETFNVQPREVANKYISGEIIYFLDHEYKLEIIEQQGSSHIEKQASGQLHMYVAPKTVLECKEKLLYDWYRAELKKQIPVLINKWQPIIGRKVLEWRIKRMKTRWGTCNIPRKRIWLNLELAKQPAACLEYVIVHEMTHLLERCHNEIFKQLLDNFMPNWRMLEKQLNYKLRE